MLRYVILLVLLSLALVGTASAVGPDDAVPTPGITLDGPTLAQDEAFSHSGAVIPAQPTSAGPRHVVYRQWAETRPYDAEKRCCAEHFGGFGPLWESYCSDRNRCCGAATGCEPAECYPTLRCGLFPPRLGLHRHPVRVRLHGPGCGCSSGAACDCACGAGMTEAGAGAMTPEPAQSPQPEPAAPAEPTPEQPEPAVDPAPPPPPPEPPAAQEAKNGSSRRGWLQRRPMSVYPR